MPVEVKFLNHGAGVRLYCTQKVTVGELLTVNTAFQSFPENIKQCQYVLVHFSPSATFDATVDELRTLADLDELVPGVNSQAVTVVVARPDAVYGLCRMWSVFAEANGWRTTVFRAEDEAKQWIRAVIGVDFDFA